MVPFMREMVWGKQKKNFWAQLNLEDFVYFLVDMMISQGNQKNRWAGKLR